MLAVVVFASGCKTNSLPIQQETAVVVTNVGVNVTGASPVVATNAPSIIVTSAPPIYPTNIVVSFATNPVVQTHLFNDLKEAIVLGKEVLDLVSKINDATRGLAKTSILDRVNCKCPEIQELTKTLARIEEEFTDLNKALTNRLGAQKTWADRIPGASSLWFLGMLLAALVYALAQALVPIWLKPRQKDLMHEKELKDLDLRREKELKDLDLRREKESKEMDLKHEKELKEMDLKHEMALRHWESDTNQQEWRVWKVRMK